MSVVEFLQIWVAAFFTLALFSFLYKDNPFYKFAEHVFAGLSAGYEVGVIWNAVILQQLVIPMGAGKWWLFVPAILGLLMFSRFFRKLHWISRISLAFVMGTTAGVFILSELHGKVLPQAQATMLSLNPSAGFGAMILSLIIVVGVITTLVYFYFSKEHTGLLGGAAKVGIWFIMISFGAHFGYTVMGRISLLIGQAHFLIYDWLGSLGRIFS